MKHEKLTTKLKRLPWKMKIHCLWSLSFIIYISFSLVGSSPFSSIHFLFFMTISSFIKRDISSQLRNQQSSGGLLWISGHLFYICHSLINLWFWQVGRVTVLRKDLQTDTSFFSMVCNLVLHIDLQSTFLCSCYRPLF